MTDVFQVQSDIATKVAQALGGRAGSGRGEAAVREADREPRGLRRLPQGRGGLEGLAVNDPPTVRKALAYYEQAVALDPNFAQGWARVSTGQLAPLFEQPSDAPARRARPAGRRQGDRARARPARGIPRARTLRTTRRSRLRRALGSSTPRRSVSRRTRGDFSGRRRRPSRPSDAARRPWSTRSRPNASTHVPSITLRRLGRHCVCAPALLRRRSPPSIGPWSSRRRT